MLKQKNNLKVSLVKIFSQITAFVICCSLYSAGFSYLFTSPVYAFKPLNNGFWDTGVQGRVNPGDYTHESITREAITQLIKDEFFPGTRITKSMEEAINFIVLTNADVDIYEATNAGAHFDSESFPDGQKRLRDKATVVKDNLNRNFIRSARRALGSALHTLQDFYSHSNWVEMNGGVPNLELGITGTISNTAGSEATCLDCIPNPSCPYYYRLFWLV